jgi:hypothetical protein
MSYFNSGIRFCSLSRALPQGKRGSAFVYPVHTPPGLSYHPFPGICVYSTQFGSGETSGKTGMAWKRVWATISG